MKVSFCGYNDIHRLFTKAWTWKKESREGFLVRNSLMEFFVNPSSPHIVLLPAEIHVKWDDFSWSNMTTFFSRKSSDCSRTRTKLEAHVFTTSGEEVLEGSDSEKIFSSPKTGSDTRRWFPRWIKPLHCELRVRSGIIVSHRRVSIRCYKRCGEIPKKTFWCLVLRARECFKWTRSSHRDVFRPLVKESLLHGLILFLYSGGINSIVSHAFRFNS